MFFFRIFIEILTKFTTFSLLLILEIFHSNCGKTTTAILNKLDSSLHIDINFNVIQTNPLNQVGYTFYEGKIKIHW